MKNEKWCSSPLSQVPHRKPDEMTKTNTLQVSRGRGLHSPIIAPSSCTILRGDRDINIGRFPRPHFTEQSSTETAPFNRPVIGTVGQPFLLGSRRHKLRTVGNALSRQPSGPLDAGRCEQFVTLPRQQSIASPRTQHDKDGTPRKYIYISTFK